MIQRFSMWAPAFLSLVLAIVPAAEYTIVEPAFDYSRAGLIAARPIPYVLAAASAVKPLWISYGAKRPVDAFARERPSIGLLSHRYDFADESAHRSERELLRLVSGRSPPINISHI